MNCVAPIFAAVSLTIQPLATFLPRPDVVIDALICGAGAGSPGSIRISRESPNPFSNKHGTMGCAHALRPRRLALARDGTPDSRELWEQ